MGFMKTFNIICFLIVLRSPSVAMARIPIQEERYEMTPSPEPEVIKTPIIFPTSVRPRIVLLATLMLSLLCINYVLVQEKTVTKRRAFIAQLMIYVLSVTMLSRETYGRYTETMFGLMFNFMLIPFMVYFSFYYID